MKKFKRKDWHKYKKLGKGCKKKIKWRKARGRDNKIRENIRGHAKKPSIGMKKPEVKEMIIRIKNLQEMNNVKKEEKIVIDRRVGKKKRKEIRDKAKEMKIKVTNLRKVEKK